MSATLPTVLFHAVAALSLFQTAPQPTTPDSAAPPDQERRASSPEQRRQRRDRFEQYRDATPEQRRQFQVDRMVDRAARTYELDETQKSLVRIEMENMQRERREAMGPEAEEYEKLREQLFHYWRPRSDGSEANPTDREDRRERRRRMMEDPEYLKTRERLRTLEQKYPVNWEDAMHRVEVLLPADQAEKGRKQIEERLARREEREQRWQDRSEGRRSRRNASDSNTPAGSFGDRSTPPKTESPSPDAQTVQTPPAPPHPWEIYVRHFIAEHELTTAQQAAAMAILKDVRSRAGQIELSLREKIAAAEKLADPASRIKRLGELHQPIEQLFTELKTRLDGLLTASQRAPAPRS